MEKVVKKINIYVAKDGKKFLNETEAKEYEEKVLNRLEKIQYFSITYSPDLTEGRGYSGVLGVAVESQYRAELLLEELCYQWFGSPIGWVQGCSPMPKYIINKSTKDFYEQKRLKAYVGDYAYPAKYLFLSSCGPIDGYPEPIKLLVNEKDKYPSKESVLDKK